MEDQDPDIPSTNPEEEAPAPRRRSLFRRIMTVLGIVIGGFLLLVVLFFVALQTNWGAARFGDFAFGIFNPYDDSDTRYAKIRGNFITWIELNDVELVRSDSLRMAHFDTVRFKYNLLSLFVGKIHLTEFYLANPELTARQQPDLSWDLINPFRPDTTAIDTLEQKRWFDFVVDKIRVTDLDLYARYYTPGRDSVLRIQNLNIDAREFLVDETESVLLDSLWGRFAPPQTEDWVNVRVAGRLDHGRMDLQSLRLFSDRSNLRASGRMVLPVRDRDYVDNIRFALVARPIHFDDIRPFFPTLPLQDSAMVTLNLTGTSRLMNVDLQGGFAEGGSIDVRGRVTPTSGPLRYELNGTVRRLDPAVIVGGATRESKINALLSVNLRGVRPEALNGTARLSLFDTNLGEYDFTPSELRLEFERGRADVNLRSGVRGTSFRVWGVTRPFDEIPTYDLAGSFQNFDVGRFSNDPEQNSDIDASFTLRGRGIDPKEANATADFRVYRSQLNRTRIDNGRINLTLADGDLSFGARVLFPEGNVFASGTAEFGDSLSYTIGRGRFDNLDLAAIIGDDVPSSLNGSFTLNGRGTNPETMLLRGRFDVGRSTYGDLNIAGIGMGALYRRGRLDVNARADLQEAGFADFLATAYPFADVPTLEIRRGEFRNVNLARLTGNPNQETDLNGTLVVSVRDFDPDRMRLRGRLDLDPSRYNEQQIQSASLIGTLQRGSLGFTANAILPEGRFSASGDARPFQDVPTYTLRDGMFDGINLGAITGNPDLRSDLNGTFALSGRGLDPETMTLDGRVYVSRSRINDQLINTATITGQMSRGTLDFDLALAAPEGRSRLNGTADFLADVPTYTVRQGTFSGLNLGALTGNPSLQSRLNGSIAFSGRGFDPETMVIDSRIRLTQSRLNEQQIDSAMVTLNLAGGVANFRMNLDVPQGETFLIGSARPFLEVPTYEVTQGSFSGLNLGALTGNAGWQTNLSGTLTLNGAGFDPETMVIDARLGLGSGTLNRAHVTGGTVNARIERGITTLDANVALLDGSMRLAARGNFFDERPVYSASGSLNNVNLGDMSGRDSLVSRLTASFDVRGEGLDPRTMLLEGTIRSDSTTYQQADVSRLDAAFRLQDGFLQVDNLSLEANFADVIGSGGIALFDTTRTSDFRFDAAIRTLEPIRPLLPFRTFALENADVTGHVFGTAGMLDFEIDGTIESLVYNDIRVAGFNGSLAGQLGRDRSLQIADISAETGYLSIPGLPAQRADLDIRYRNQVAEFSGDLQISRNRNIHVVGRADLRAEAQVIELDTLNFRIDNDLWQLLQPATITFNGEYRVSGLLLYSDEGQLAVDGVVDPDGQQNLVLTLENFRMGAISDLVGYKGLDGRISGSLDLTGPASAPNLTGSLGADLVSNNQPVGDLRLDVRYDSLRLNLNALLTNPDGSSMHMTGFVPMDLALAPSDSAAVVGEGFQIETADASSQSGVDLHVVADSFSIGWISPFLDPEEVENIGGRLSGAFDITGSMESPILSGDMRLADGYIRLPEFEVTYRDITMNATLQNNQVQINQLVAHSGDGRLEATGTVSLTQLTLGEFDIDASLVRFWAVDNDQYRASVSGNIELRGTTRAPVVTGSVELVHTDIFMDEVAAVSDLERVELTEDDLRMLSERFGYDVTESDTTTLDFYEAMDISLDVELARDMWIRQTANPEMAIQFSGDLDFRKRPYGEEEIFGTIEVVPQRSFIDQFGRRFTMRDGSITFNGSATTFVMNAEAEYRIRTRRGNEAEAVIILALSGRPDNLRTELRSEPDMEQSDIISYIATGQPADPSLLLGGEYLLSQGTGIALSQLTSVVEGAAQEGLGLDVVQVQIDPFGTTELVAGKYLDSRLYVGITQQLTGGPESTDGASGRAGTRTAFTVEYQFIDWLLLRLGTQNGSVMGNLLWEFSY